MIAIGLTSYIISVVEAIEEEVEDIDYARLNGFGLVNRNDGYISTRKPCRVGLAVVGVVPFRSRLLCRVIDGEIVVSIVDKVHILERERAWDVVQRSVIHPGRCIVCKTKQKSAGFSQVPSGSNSH